MDCKKLIAGFGIRQGQAWKLNDLQSCYNEDLLSLARYLGDSGADELFIYDISDTEEDHENILKAVSLPPVQVTGF